MKWTARLFACALVVATLIGCKPEEETMGVSLTGLDHLAEHLSVQDFWVNGQGGFQAGKGGSTVGGGPSIPKKWRPDLTVKVQWGVTNWKRKVYSMHERVVPVDKYDESGVMYVHFLRDGSVRVVVSEFYPEGSKYPGPPYSTVPQKQPWHDYPRQPGEPEFTQVQNAMEEQ